MIRPCLKPKPSSALESEQHQRWYRTSSCSARAVISGYVSMRTVVPTRSSTATFLDFHTNSQTAMTQATPMPPMSTTNTPPTFASPSSLAAEEDFEVSSWKCKEVESDVIGESGEYNTGYLPLWRIRGLI